ncbi:hypothetical protein [Candidatus Nitrososphaera evergladensis]|uniref:hypothetical protein n=1 Tax=Candidatus Nitrososphaera evergladensis TaxID=1459637 RepID=UPI0011E5C56E|nr:hypothetical protein [Candidatus Nitrososphaera evergladensis]
MDNSELEVSVVLSLIRMATRSSLSRKLGSVLYSITAYENIQRITVPIYNTVSELDGILMISVDADVEIRGNTGKMILDKAEELISPLRHSQSLY